MECTRCGGTHLVKNGSVHGVPKWLCRGCGYQSCRRGQPGKPESLKLQAVVLYLHGLSMNAVAKLFGVSAPAVLKWIKSYAHRHGSKPEPITGGVVIMELDEMWHYLKKSAANCGSRRLIVAIPASWLTGNVGIVIKPPATASSSD